MSDERDGNRAEPTPAEALWDAIAAGELDAALDLIEADRTLAAGTSPDGLPLALAAVYRGHPEIADLLLRHGAALDAWVAAALGRTDRLRVLLERGEADLAGTSPDGWTMLHLAAHFGRREAAELLLERGADVGARSANALANTPLHAAAAGGRHPLVELLLARGADPDAVAEGITPLDIARGRGDAEMETALNDARARRARPEGD